MLVRRTGHLIYAHCCIMLLFSQRPCQATPDSSTAVGHGAFLGAVLKQLNHAQRIRTCSHRQEVAQAVLEYVSKGPSPQSRRSAAGALPDSRPSQVNITSHDLQLPRYIHHLPSAPAPAAWWELCQTLHTRGLEGLQSSLEHHKKQLPDVQHAAAAHCQLGRHPWGYTFSNSALSAYVASLFYSIVAGRAAAARRLLAPAPQLNRFDLFHGHIFTSHGCSKGNRRVSRASNDSRNTRNIDHKLSTQRSCSEADRFCEHLGDAATVTSSSNSSSYGCQVGILFHAAEYPAYDEAMFPVNLGHCQVNSSCCYKQRSMDLRNILWWQGQLAVLDVGADSPLHHLLLHEGTEPLRTLYEEDFGKAVADVLLLQYPHRRRRQLAAEQQRLQRMYVAMAAAGQGRRLPHITANEGQEVGVYVSY